MVQRTGYGGSRVRGSDPTEAARAAPQVPAMQSFMDSVLSPFVQCVSPPIQACVSPTPWQPRHVPRASSSPVPVSPVSSKSSYITHQFGENDVLCGKGRSSICHPGNQRFREIVEANKGEYARATRKQKVYLAHSVVDLIRKAQPPGRFLLRDVETGRWYDIGRNRSFEKTSQALREKVNPSVAAGLPAQTQRAFGRPSLIVPRHLQHIYQTPAPSSEYRNPPHSAEVHAPHGMYMYPIPSASSYEMISPCGSNVSESNTSVSHGIVTPPSLARGARPSTPTSQTASPHSSPSQARVPTSPPHNTPSVVTPPPLYSSPSHESAQSFGSSFLFDTPVDGGYHENMVSPSTVRRSRHSSEEDGLAALSAAAFLKLDEE